MLTSSALTVGFNFFVASRVQVTGIRGWNVLRAGNGILGMDASSGGSLQYYSTY